MLMDNPPHPGEIIKSLWLDPLVISVTDAAEALNNLGVRLNWSDGLSLL